MLSHRRALKRLLALRETRTRTFERFARPGIFSGDLRTRASPRPAPWPTRFLFVDERHRGRAHGWGARGAAAQRVTRSGGGCLRSFLGAGQPLGLAAARRRSGPRRPRAAGVRANSARRTALARFGQAGSMGTRHHGQHRARRAEAEASEALLLARQSASGAAR